MHLLFTYKMAYPVILWRSEEEQKPLFELQGHCSPQLSHIHLDRSVEKQNGKMVNYMIPESVCKPLLSRFQEIC